jgi:hypothetical protein
MFWPSQGQSSRERAEFLGITPSAKLLLLKFKEGRSCGTVARLHPSRFPISHGRKNHAEINGSTWLPMRSARIHPLLFVPTCRHI